MVSFFPPIILRSIVSYRFLTKLLTEDLPRLFVRPKKIVLDFQKGKAVGPVSEDLKSGEMQEGNKDFVGELSVTLVDAQNLRYMFSGKLYSSFTCQCFLQSWKSEIDRQSIAEVLASLCKFIRLYWE